MSSLNGLSRLAISGLEASSLPPEDRAESKSDLPSPTSSEFEIITREFIEEISGPEGLAEFDRIAASVKEQSRTTWYTTFCDYTFSKLGWPTTKAEKAESLESIHLRILEKLESVTGDSIIDNPEVLNLIEAYAKKIQSPPDRILDPSRIKKYIIIGENIAKLLFSPNYNAENGLKLELTGEEYSVPCNLETTRALSWYVMASAASQDVFRKHRNGGALSDLLDSGSIIMKDPDSRIFRFLTGNRDSYYRISSHFPERAGHNVSFFGSPWQRGIDDNGHYLPCDGGTLLFDTLKPDSKGTPELFIKFEKHGFPPLVSPQAFRAWVGHASEYIKTRSEGGYNAGDNLRQEHTYKGFLKDVHKKIKDLVEKAGKEGVLTSSEVSEFLASVKRTGIIQIRQFVNEKLCGKASDAFETSAANVIKEIDDNVKALGFASDQYGIERRGAEVHISLNPADVNKNADITEDRKNTHSEEHVFSIISSVDSSEPEDAPESSEEKETEVDEETAALAQDAKPVAEEQALPTNAGVAADAMDKDVASSNSPEVSSNLEAVPESLVLAETGGALESNEEKEAVIGEETAALAQGAQPVAEEQTLPANTGVAADAMDKGVASSDSSEVSSNLEAAPENLDLAETEGALESSKEKEAVIGEETAPLAQDAQPVAEEPALPTNAGVATDAMDQGVASSDSSEASSSLEAAPENLGLAEHEGVPENIEQRDVEPISAEEKLEADPQENTSPPQTPEGFFSRIFSLPKKLFLGFYNFLLDLGNRIWRFFKW